MLKVTKGNATHIKVELYYAMGGMNYFTGNSEARGLYLSVTPVSRTEHGNGMISESYTAFSGVKELVKPMTRFSQKVLDTFEVGEQSISNLLSYVLDKTGMEVE